MPPSDSPDSSDHETFVLSPEILARLKHLDVSAYVEFRETKVVCAGAYGDVSKLRCTLPNRGPGKIRVAIKRLRFYMREDIVTLFEREIYVWSKLDHTNVLPLLGFAFDDKTGYPLLVSEWMANGSAWDFVRAHPECDLMHLVTGIAEGLAYLHKQGVVHSDIKPTNILVSDDGDALIADFGCARMVDASLSLANLSSGLKGTTRYLAYEILAVEDTSTGYSDKTDVWAFGMTVFELFTLQRPYHQLRETQVALAIVEYKLPRRPTECAWQSLEPEDEDRLWDICQSCWIHDPIARASMEKILEKLRNPRGLSNAPLMQDEQGLLTVDDAWATISRYQTRNSASTEETVTYDSILARSSPLVKVPSRTSQIRRKTWARIRALFSRKSSDEYEVPTVVVEDL